MSYISGSLENGIRFYNYAVSDLDNGRNDSAQTQLKLAQQIFEQCQGTHAEAKKWLEKTNKKLREIGS